MKIRLQNKSGLSAAGLVVLGVVLYTGLNHLDVVLGAVGTFLGFFSTVFVGAVIAYLVNPLAKLFQTKVLGKVRRENVRIMGGNVLAFLSVLVFFVLAFVLIVPQLMDSAMTFVGKLEGYTLALEQTVESFGLSLNSELFDSGAFVDSSVDIVETLRTIVGDNLQLILAKSAGAGKNMVQILIAFILSIYILAEKKKLQEGGGRLLKAVTKDRYPEVKRFLVRCNEILNSYIVFNLLDALLVGVINAAFMAIMGMPYIGMISLVVGATNLIPTFGPLIGAVVGGFILLLASPKQALAFLIFTIVLQTLDGYVIKPKLFGDSLGVSGLWILVGVIAGGQMFGVLGILLAIPVVAIIDFIYKEYILPALEKGRRKEETQEETGGDQEQTR